MHGWLKAYFRQNGARMKRNLLMEIKRTLQKKSAEVARGIEQTRQYLFTKTNLDLFEAAQGELDRETSAALASYGTALLGKIQVALKRLDDGSYGTCSQCGDVINSRRLQALPWAIYCLSCQEIRDDNAQSLKSHF
jgi:DnaK suppressor protein